MKTPIRALVLPGGTEIGLEIQRALALTKEIELYSAAAPIPNHAPLVFSQHRLLPNVDDPTWLSSLNKLIEADQIDCVLPAHDDVIVALAENESQIKARCIISPRETCRITRSKSETYSVLHGAVRTPALYSSPADVTSYPVFVKPDRGQGSQGAAIARNRGELDALFSARAGLLILEYLPGAEYTIDCFSDRDRGLLFCGGRERSVTRNGITVDSHAVEHPEFRSTAEKISAALPFHGAWFFQLKLNRTNELTLLEAAPRIAGTMAFHRVQGVNFPLLSIYENLREPVGIIVNKGRVEINRALTNRYQHNFEFDHVYLDFDDTVILRGKINLLVIRLVHQWLNHGKRITLITKHAKDIQQTLRQYRIAELFDAVIHLTKEQAKVDFMDPEGAIFIDDSFSERRAVHDRFGIPTFDCSMLELLVDDRA